MNTDKNGASAQRRRLRTGLLTALLAYAAFLRVCRIGDLPPGLFRDEAMNGVDARSGFAVFYPANNGREGLFIGVQRLSVEWFGNESWALRLPSAVFGVLTVAGVYLLGAEWFGFEVGLLAAFFLATSFWHLNFSRVGLRAITAPCFLTWALYLLYAAMRRGRWWLMAMAGVVYGLGFYTYLAYRATPLLLALVLWRRRGWGLFTAASVITVVPLAMYFVPHPETFAQYPARISVLHHARPVWEVVLNVWRTARMFFWHGDPNWRHNVAYRAELYWPVAALFAAGVVMAVWRKITLPIVWVVVAAIPAVLADDVMPHALRSLLMIPAVFLLAALGAREVWMRLRLPAAAVAAIALWLAWEPYHTYFDVWARSPQVAEAFDSGDVEVARRVREMRGDVVVLVPASNPMLAEPVRFLAGEERVRYVAWDGSTVRIAPSTFPADSR